MNNLRKKHALLQKSLLFIHQSSTTNKTPQSLVEKMLDQISNEFWSNPKATFCDLTCGCGTFLLEIFVRRMEALQVAIPNENERATQVIRTLYGADNNFVQFETSISLLLKLTSQYGITREMLRLYNVDSLLYNFGMKFDVLVGNPPFQPETKERMKGSGSASKIWHKFIELAITLSNVDGFLLFVTPHNWRMGNFKQKSAHREIQKFIWNHKLCWYANVRNPIDYFPTIGYSNNVDAWCVQNVKINKTSRLQELYLAPANTNANSICEKFFHNFEEIFTYQKQQGIDRENDIRATTTGTANCKWKVANTSAQVRKGLFNWTAKEPKHFFSKKVIVSESGSLDPWYDDGTCGNGNHTSAFIVSSQEEGKKLIDFLNSKLINFIASQFMLPNALGFPLELFERIPKEVIEKPWQEVFGFTQEELDIIESHAN